MSSIADTCLSADNVYVRGDMSGVLKLAEMLPQTSLTSLKCAAAARYAKSTLAYQRPLTPCTFCLGSVDGHPLPIDELKGTKPTEMIDLSGKRLEVASGIIIASCIKSNNVLKSLKCAACPL